MEDGKDFVDVPVRGLLGMGCLVTDSTRMAIVDIEPGTAVGTVDSFIDGDRSEGWEIRPALNRPCVTRKTLTHKGSQLF